MATVSPSPPTAAVPSSRPRVPPLTMPPHPQSKPKPSAPVPHPRSKPILTWLQRKLAPSSRRHPAPTSPAPAPSSPQTYTSARASYRPLGSPPPGGVPMHDLLPSNASVSASTWAPTEPGVADDDASTRPLPPTSPPSPAPSRGTSVSTRTGGGRSGGSNSSSNWPRGPHHQHQASAALSVSTKPTTLLSIDGTLPAARTGPAASIHFTPLPPSSPPPSSPPTPTPPPPLARTRIPPHSHPNPARNPDPLAQPGDNASMWTLASSTGGRRYETSVFTVDAGGEGEEGEGEWEEGASVRAIKPRSRRGSWGTGTGTGGGSLSGRLDLDPDAEEEDEEEEEEEGQRVLEDGDVTDEPAPITPTNLTAEGMAEAEGLSTPVPVSREMESAEEVHEEIPAAVANGNGHVVVDGEAEKEEEAHPAQEGEKADAL